MSNEPSYSTQASREMIAAGARKLVQGSLVAFPTETVYGLGADATNEAAVARIYQVKGRPSDHPLIVHFADPNLINEWAIAVPDYAFRLAKEFWPGPMTLILKRSNLAKDFITGNQDSVGLRVPAHPVALALLNQFQELGGKGVAAPSANRFGGVSPTTANAVLEELIPYLDINRDQILDGGTCLVGVESTIIDARSEVPIILRPGAITQEMIFETIGLKALDQNETISDSSNNNIEKVRVSGSLESHYSPKAKVILNAIAQSGEGFIALSNIPTPNGAIRLASPKTNEEYARVIYAALRDADARELSKVIVIEPEGDGIAIAIRDRLKRASA